VADAFDGRRRAQGRIGAVIKDKWRIDARLGTGGMATVYAATHRNGNRVAIKMLNLDYSREPTVRARFLREGYVANAVGHPGAVKVLDDDTAEDGCAFLVMELLEGESLEARRERVGGRLPMQEVFTVGDQLLDLLAAAHPKGIVHRDVKPENIFITHDGSVKLLDFGIARMRESSGVERTGTGLMLGTPDFMSPEQASGRSETIDARSDLWSLGATMFTLLSGQSVHISQTLRDHLYATATMRARSLATAAPDVAAALVSVVDRALELDKERRWPDARAMQDALRWAYKAVHERGVVRSGEPMEAETVTVHMPAAAPVEIGDEATRVEPMSLQPTSDETVMHPVPAAAREYPREAPREAPRVPTPAPPTPPPGTEPIPRGFSGQRQPAAPQQGAPQAQLQPPPAQAMQGMPGMAPQGARSPSDAWRNDAGGSASMPQAQPYAPYPYPPHYPQATPAPHLMQPPATLGAQFTDPRYTTGTAVAPRSRLLVIALVALVTVVAVLATLFVLTGTRDGSGTRARKSPSDAPPSASPTAVPPTALGTPPPALADADTDAGSPLAP
jgi:serine/threonine protein kinase